MYLKIQNLHQHIRDNMQYMLLLVWVISLQVIISVYIPTVFIISFYLTAE